MRVRVNALSEQRHRPNLPVRSKIHKGVFYPKIGRHSTSALDPPVAKDPKKEADFTIVKSASNINSKPG
jgi:hypothetical protein